MAMDDENEPRFKKNAPQIFPRSLEGVSVREMQAYLAALDEEKIRVQQEIEHRGGHRAAAEALFGKGGA